MKKFKGFIPGELINSIKDKKCILFVGAGLSSSVKRSNGINLPNWKWFLDELLEFAIDKRVIFSVNPDDIKEMIQNDNLIMAAQEIQETISNHDFGDFLQQVFRDKYVKPSATHKLLPQIPFRSIMTSNYDNLIEGAYTLHHSGTIPNKFTQEDLLNISSPLRKDDFYIFKVHGDLDRPNTIVLGSRGYQKLFFRSPEYRQFLETLFSVYTVLFIGYGASDPDLENVLDRLSSIFNRTIDKHYILLPDHKFNFAEKKRLLLDKRLEVIEYKIDETHTQVDAFLSDLTEIFKEQQMPEKENKKYDAFISYSHNNIKEIERLRSFLMDVRLSVWYDMELKPSQDIQNTLTEAINNSRFMIIVITKDYYDSEWLKKELEIGLLKQVEGKINVIPISIGPIDFQRLPKELQNIHFLQLNENFSIDDLKPLIKMMKRDQ
ncbi:toll/interleukin-1 receptor domain-containing protein [Salinimicrobium terrae]|uniref:toll/interleukin-1 receptor domain-containing protein n=1 Tax=Salinimicrobium terrae TaxID=470866 RepID=UPI0004910C5D|nr:toll/interleukin-1 receptor domain-containing protein [Salinimicrobium terrae]